MSAPDIGFERIAANRTLVIADGGNPSPVGQGAHAGTLSFEMSVGKQRVIVNCVPIQVAMRPGAWPSARRPPIPHCGGGQELSRDCEDGTIGATGVTATSERLEADGNTWIDMSHDGYLASHDVVQAASLYQRIGLDIRGEDTLEGSGDHKFRSAFTFTLGESFAGAGRHISPVETARQIWLADAVFGRIASLQESIYLGTVETKRTEQIVIVGALQQGAAQSMGADQVDR